MTKEAYGIPVPTEDMGVASGPGAHDGWQRFTVGFLVRDDAAWDALWKVLRSKYRYNRDGSGQPVQAFAFSASDMFAEQTAIDAILESDLDGYELREILREVPCHSNLDALLAEREVNPDPFAQGTEARRAETENTGSVHDGPVAEGDAPNNHHDTNIGEER